MPMKLTAVYLHCFIFNLDEISSIRKRTFVENPTKAISLRSCLLGWKNLTRHSEVEPLIFFPAEANKLKPFFSSENQFNSGSFIFFIILNFTDMHRCSVNKTACRKMTSISSWWLMLFRSLCHGIRVVDRIWMNPKSQTEFC